MKKKKILSILFILIIIVSISLIIIDFNRPSENDILFETTPEEIIVSEEDKESVEIKEDISIKLSPDVDLNAARKDYGNNDIIGRLEIPDLFNILVVKGSNNEYYLTHSIERKEDIRGSEFMDYRLNVNSKQINIYGHNSRDEKIQVPFLRLEKFLTEDFFLNNPYIIFQYDDGKSFYEIISIKEITTDYEHMNFNTTGDEMFPYVRDSVTIYFASNGHPGAGGLDLFKATQDSTGHWKVENLGFPINSSSDDFGITFEGNKEKGFFSSNRNDARGFDHIYSFEKPTITVRIEGIVNDVDEYPIEDATVRIVGKDGLNAKVQTKKDGTYEVELERDIKYVMMASARGFLNQNYELHTSPEEKSETYIVDFFLSPISKPVVIENIFYDFDKATLRPESKKALDEMIKMLNDNPNVTIELGAHTDRKGTDKYNEKLAQRRAQSVVDYLIAGGIAADRLEAKGYGESVPKTINKKMAKQFDFLKEGDVLTEDFILKLTPEQQEIADQINRRTEFKVLRTNYNLF